MRYGIQYGPDAVSFQIAQVGDDRKAEEFLAALDAHPKVGGLIDSTGNFEMESAQMKRMTGQDMDPSLWLCKMLLGAIDSYVSLSLYRSDLSNLTLGLPFVGRTTPRMSVPDDRGRCRLDGRFIGFTQKHAKFDCSISCTNEE